MPGIGEAGMTLIGAAIGLAGKKPKVPAAPMVSPQEAQKKAVSGNLAALPSIEKLASEADAFSSAELLKNLERVSPGITGALSKIPGILSDQLEGKVPEDVARQIKQQVGAQAFASGLSPQQRASLSAEAIGSTSYQIQQQGVTSAERWMSQVTGSMPTFNFASMFITPTQQIASDMWNETMRFNTEWLRNRISAMPSPLENAEMGALQSFGSTVDQYGGMALGMMGGGPGSFSDMGKTAGGGFDAGSAVGGLFGGRGGSGASGNLWNYPSS